MKNIWKAATEGKSFIKKYYGSPYSKPLPQEKAFKAYISANFEIISKL